ncbi:methionine ABC transporter ATP-binding protein [Paenibacillus caui]|uniref:methionine ABC transporter ATP-binding protein n=1 Tax=Paenibacillus caui TaxID=2873927 RepID=UPI001F161838|nr:methionine ABC transporter ATP-binding protein [Paenibacillus caui]
MIELIGLTKQYRSRGKMITAVDEVNLHIAKGDIYGIVGYSGAGKSSLLRCMNLLEKPTRGEVVVNGVELTKLSKEELRLSRQKIGMIFQHFNLITSKTVAENVAFNLKAAGKKKEDIPGRVKELLDLVGLLDKADYYPAQLSGGQKQRVGIARAIANDPHVLLCDEATSALDPKTTESILELLKEINKKLNLTIVLITHEMEVVKEICNRVAVMESGRIVEEGGVYQIFSDPKESLTRDFIDKVMQFSLPDRLMKSSSGTIVKILFREAKAEEAVVSDVLQSCQVKGNILHGKIEYIQDAPLGFFVMELTGEREEVDKAVALLDEKTAGVEVMKP